MLADRFARLELRLTLRSRALAVTAVLAALAGAAVAGLGVVTFRQLGLRAVTPSALALLDLLLLVPTLVAVVLGATALGGSGDASLRAMLRARGVSAADLALAKVLAAAAGAAMVTVAAATGAGLALSGTAGARDLAPFAVILVAALLACGALAAAGVVVAALADRAQSLPAAIAVWGVLALGVDLLLLGLAPLVRAGGTALLVAAAADPIEAARLAGLLALGADAQVLGATGALLRSELGPGPALAGLLAVPLAWTAGLTWLAGRVLGRRDG